MSIIKNLSFLREILNYPNQFWKLLNVGKKRKFHQVRFLEIIAHKHFKGRGKPKKDAEKDNRMFWF
jgi:hypothetical protein